MSKYTTEVRYICEQYAGLEESEGYNRISDIIDASRSKIFDFDYPIFDETYRSVLENKILRHFYLREICAETVGVWKHFLDMRMNEIMPYYNKLYESELIEFNPLYDVDLTKDYKKTDDGLGTVVDELDGEKHAGSRIADTGNVQIYSSAHEGGTDTYDKTGYDQDEPKNTRWDVYSDTPQGGLTDVENETYLTNARKITDNGQGSKTTYNSTNEETKDLTTTGNSTTTNNLTRNITDNETTNNTSTKTRNLRDIEDYLEHVKGKSAGTSFSKLLQEFRDTFLNIDVMIINDLNDLFFGLW